MNNISKHNNALAAKVYSEQTIATAIDSIIAKLTAKEITLEQAKQEVLNLFDVSNNSELQNELRRGNIVMLETIDLLTR